VTQNYNLIFVSAKKSQSEILKSHKKPPYHGSLCARSLAVLRKWQWEQPLRPCPVTAIRLCG